MAEEIQELKEAEQTTAAPARREESNWLWGGILILIGVALLISNFTQFRLDNWWALIIVALGGRNVWRAWQHYRADAAWSGRARSMLTWGGMITLAGVILFFDWDFGTLWPLFIIIIGLGSLVAAMSDR